MTTAEGVNTLINAFGGYTLDEMHAPLLPLFLLTYILTIFAIAFAFGFVYRVLLRFIARKVLKHYPSAEWQNRGLYKNINTRGRVLRLVISGMLLAWAVRTAWSPVLLFFSGFTLFEAVFSWCGFNAALGVNQCTHDNKNP